MSDETKDYRTTIDTMGIDIPFNNLDDITRLNEENRDKSSLFKAINYNKKKDDIENQKVHVVVKIHNIYKDHGKEFYVESYGKHKDILKELFKDMGIKNDGAVTMSRVDIAVDRAVRFDDEFKKHLYLFELVTYGNKKNSRWYTTNLDTLERNTIRLSNNSFDVCFYDKEEESNGMFEYKTRLEFRMKRLKSNDTGLAIDKLIERLNKVDKNIEKVNFDMVEILNKKWDKCKDHKENLNFSTFVSNNQDYFYNMEILTGVYKHIGLKSDVRIWMNKFRKTNELVLISNREIGIMQQDIIREIKRYKKS